MTLYEKLDIVADSYNPLLLMTAIVLLLYAFKSKGKMVGLYKVVLLIALIAIVYAMQFIDKQSGLWAAFGRDYSTHTAFSMAIVFFVLFDGRAIKSAIIFSFVCYLGLMLYQKYHTVTDIVTTVLVVSPFMYAATYYAHRRLTKRSAPIHDL